MPDDSGLNLGPVDFSEVQRQIGDQKADQTAVQQIASDESFTDGCEEVFFNPWAADRLKKDKFKPLDQRTPATKKGDSERLQAMRIETTNESARKYQQKNPELNPRVLTSILNSLKDGDPPGVILQRVLAMYSDCSLADEVLEFLAENSGENMREEIKKAKEELTRLFGKRIIAGKNIAQQARLFSEKGLGSPTALRDIYRDVTTNPRDTLDLFEEFASKYPFEKLTSVFQFMFHSLGSDLNAKGPSIPKGELHRLMTETRSLQAILGIYRYFRLRLNLITRYFTRHNLPLPRQLTFEFLAKHFVKLAADRYPSPSKVLQIGELLQLEEEEALIILLTQFRDAIRSLSPRIYKTDKQRNDLLQAIMQALENLEEEEEEEEEDKEEKDKEGKKKEKKKKPPPLPG